jgi:hypothetical protein
LQLVDELLDVLLPLGELAEALHAVDDEQRRPPLLERVADQVEQAVQAVVAEGLVAADVVDAVGDDVGPEEVQRRQVAEHLGVRLDQQGHVDAAAVRGGDVVEAELVAQDGLAASRRPHHGVGAPLEEAPLEDVVEPGDAALDPVLAARDRRLVGPVAVTVGVGHAHPLSRIDRRVIAPATAPGRRAKGRACGGARP